MMTARTLQLLLGAIFLGLGGWCLTMPRLVESLVFRPEFQVLSPTSAILMGCFGAQAVLAGSIIVLSDFRPRTFLGFGLLGSLPFFAFNYYFYFIEPVFTDWMLLDFVGNLGILACGVLGYRLRKAELARAA